MNVSALQFWVNGTAYPAQRFETDWTKGNYVRAYNDFVSLIGLDTATNIGLTMEMYKSCLAFWGIDLSGCPGCNNSHFHKLTEQRGSISVEITFSTSPDTSMQLMTYATHRKVLRVDALRSISLDY